MPQDALLDKGTLTFTIEGRILRELGERLVKQPDVALVELVKNSYDADATKCEIIYDPESKIIVADNGTGMTLARFRAGWMRIGTSAKEETSVSERYRREITGEKGIGRFAVRFLGRVLHLETVADDHDRKRRTRLIADFDWPKFDRHQDLGNVEVPYRLEAAPADAQTGTTLEISRLRPEVQRVNLQRVRTGSIGVLTPLRSLFRQISGGADDEQRAGPTARDPGFILDIKHDGDDEPEDVAAAILEGFVLRATLRLKGEKVEVKIYRRDQARPYLKIIETYKNEIGKLYADIRFFPRRKGSFAGMPVDGRVAFGWIAANSGVAVFDRGFRVLPYGLWTDDWLRLTADAARSRRDPRSKLAAKHFPMSNEVRSTPSENWMLRLPQSAQLVGLVLVEGRRVDGVSEDGEGTGLVASADREGFVENQTFAEFQDLVRGAVEAIAYADRSIQLEEEKAEQDALVASIRQQAQSAISEVQANPNIPNRDKVKIVAALASTQQLAERQEEAAHDREQQLEIMSLLGVVAGFMTHEFGVALQELEATHSELQVLARSTPRFAPVEQKFAGHIKILRDFVTYSSGYIQGARIQPEKPYPVRPRIQQVKRIFGKYAEERDIQVEISVDQDLMAPMVPPSLYNGIALNLYTNALKAVTARSGQEKKVIAFRAWNDSRWHNLEVSDTGVGIPTALQERVFDPLFTTTESRRDPLGSGMGLGLTLVRRCAQKFGGRADVVAPPPDFATCVRVRLPRDIEASRS